MEQALREAIFEALLGCPEDLAQVPALRSFVTKEIDAIAPVVDRAMSASAERLAAHWLFTMECDHEEKRDRVICVCGFRSEWHPTVGEAARAWAEHALDAARIPK